MFISFQVRNESLTFMSHLQILSVPFTVAILSPLLTKGTDGEGLSCQWFLRLDRIKYLHVLPSISSVHHDLSEGKECFCLLHLIAKRKDVSLLAKEFDFAFADAFRKVFSYELFHSLRTPNFAGVGSGNFSRNKFRV